MMNEVRNTLRSTTMFNLITLAFVFSCSFAIETRYIIVMALGLLVGIINLYTRALMIIPFSQNNATWKPAKYFAGYALRVGFTALAGGLLFLLDKYYVAAYMGGYILHFSGVILHGFKLMLMEGK